MRRTCMLAVAAILLFAGRGLAEEGKIGRPVRLVSIGFQQRPLQKIVPIVEAEAAQGTDLIILPETFAGQVHPETLEGKTVTVMAEIAKKHHTYIVCPVDRKDGDKRLNSAVLLDREGKVAGVYDKVFPFWSEYKLKQPVNVGNDAPVFETDFGKVGIAICFDANFPEVWQHMGDLGAELVVFSSAYSAGMSLQAQAAINHYYVVSSTLRADCHVFDISGELLLYEKSNDVNITRTTLDLDRCIFHLDYNMHKHDKLLKEHQDEVVQDKWWDREAWFILKANKPGVSARTLAHEYGMEELRDYVSRSRYQINQMRGYPFATKAAEEQEKLNAARFPKQQEK